MCIEKLYGSAVTPNNEFTRQLTNRYVVIFLYNFIIMFKLLNVMVVLLSKLVVLESP